MDQGQVLSLSTHCQFKSVSDTPFSTFTGIYRTLSSYFIFGSFSEETTFACVSTFGILANYYKFMAIFQNEWPQIDV